MNNEELIMNNTCSFSFCHQKEKITKEKECRLHLRS